MVAMKLTFFSLIAILLGGVMAIFLLIYQQFGEKKSLSACAQTRSHNIKIPQKVSNIHSYDKQIILITEPYDGKQELILLDNCANTQNRLTLEIQ